MLSQAEEEPVGVEIGSPPPPAKGSLAKLVWAGGLSEADGGATPTARLVASASQALDATLVPRATAPIAAGLAAPAAASAPNAATADSSIAAAVASVAVSSAAAAASVATATATGDPSKSPTASTRAGVCAGDVADHR